MDGDEPNLTDLERRILAFEKRHWRYPGAKESAVLDEFGWSLTRYYQVLHALIDTPRARAAEPLLVGRLLRLRDRRRRGRSERPASG